MKVNLKDFYIATPYTVQATATLRDVLHLFQRMGLRHLPVVDMRNQVVGMITRKDIVRYSAVLLTYAIVPRAGGAPFAALQVLIDTWPIIAAGARRPTRGGAPAPWRQETRARFAAGITVAAVGGGGWSAAGLGACL